MMKSVFSESENFTQQCSGATPATSTSAASIRFAISSFCSSLRPSNQSMWTNGIPCSSRSKFAVASVELHPNQHRLDAEQPRAAPRVGIEAPQDRLVHRCESRRSLLPAPPQLQPHPRLGGDVPREPGLISVHGDQPDDVAVDRTPGEWHLTRPAAAPSARLENDPPGRDAGEG